jgi:hypothetical protein
MRGSKIRGMAWRALLVFLLACAFPAQAQGPHTLYAASSRIHAASEPGAIVGNLYTINLSNGTATLVGAVRLPDAKPIAITGLSVHPVSGVFYGVTSPQSPNAPRALVVVDPVTANATLVGELTAAVSDITFDSAGALYGWIPATSQIGMINVANGSVATLGRPSASSTPAGIAIDANNVAFLTRTGATGTLDTVDLHTGDVKTGPALTGAPFPSVINSMSFSPSGLLLAVNSNAGAPASTRLVAINTATGAISVISALPDDTDALTFNRSGRTIAPTLSTMSPGARVVIAVISTVLLVLAGLLLLRRK